MISSGRNASDALGKLVVSTPNGEATSSTALPNVEDASWGPCQVTLEGDDCILLIGGGDASGANPKKKVWKLNLKHV